MSAFMGLFWLWTALAPGAETAGADDNVFGADDEARRTAKIYQEAKQRFRTEAEVQSNKVQAAWQFGRACFDVTLVLRDKGRRADFAEQGIAACRQAVAADSNSAPAHYYLGMNLGALADTRRNLGALRMVRDMEREFSTARDLDPHFDFAGPDRNLGMLYFQAPSFISIGNRSKARHHLERAVVLAPDYPENRLILIDALLKWNELDAARKQVAALDQRWSEARQRLSGPQWTASWTNWEHRLRDAQKRLGHESAPLESPRQSGN